jgi:hypothetical protein
VLDEANRTPIRLTCGRRSASPADAATATSARSPFGRVVTLEDGETIHNAFSDRGFRKDGS